ncbi:MAG: HPr(Ser) kinase/phosphatase [Acutalibacteraceae bacterium]
MESKFSVPLKNIIDELNLEVINLNSDPEKILLTDSELNRPGLHLANYYEFFETQRIQIFGLSEISYLKTLKKEDYTERIKKFFKHSPVAVVVTRGLEIEEEFISLAKEFNIPLLRTPYSTSAFMTDLNAYLNIQLAPRITRHGVLVEVYGEGILLLGESGVGKSETAIELMKRGHRLIADDAVEIRRVSSKTLVGTAPENIRHFVELRGIGIINARRIFGMGAVKLTEKIDMIINLEQWDPDKIYDRMGLDNETTEILGINITSTTIPIKPGRNLAIIIEIAAMNNRQKKMGYNAAQELLHKLGMDSDENIDPSLQKEWDAFK